MTMAIERLIMADTAEGKRQASKWTAAWDVASGSAVVISEGDCTIFLGVAATVHTNPDI